MSDTGTTRSGLLFGIAAYTLWGVFPLYFMLLGFASSIEIVANRILWSLLLCSCILAVLNRLGDLVQVLREPRQLGYLAIAAGLISANWLGYVYAANHGQVLQASLGYFINPLITVLLAVLILREPLRPLQWAAMLLALVAVISIGIAYGHPPWLALLLATSFGLYSLTKKFAGRRTGAFQSLTIETLLLSPLAFAVLLWLNHKGETHFTYEGLTSVLLLTSTGLATTVPLTSFAAAARRLPLSTLGMLQYIAPTLQFIVAVAIVHETMTPLRWFGFVLIWIALALFSVDLISMSRQRRQSASLRLENPARLHPEEQETAPTQSVP